MGVSEQFVSDNPNICLSCANLMDDIQDSTIIESAVPYEPEACPDSLPEGQPDPVADKVEVTPVELASHKIGV